MAQLLALSCDGHRIEMIDLTEGTRRVILTDTGLHPDGVVCDGAHIYWTTMGERTSHNSFDEAVYNNVDGGVHAISVHGDERRDLIAPGGITTGKQLVLDSNDNLYFGNREGFALATVRTDGTGLRNLVKHDGTKRERDWIVGVAINETRGHIYWSQKGSESGGDGQIFRAGIEIPVGETAENRTDIELLWHDLPAPVDLELDGEHIFWTDRGRQPGGDSLNRAPIPAPGQPGKQPIVLAEGFQDPIGLAVDGVQKLAYVADLGGRIWVVPGPGNPEMATHIAIDLGFPITGLNLVQALDSADQN